MGMLNVEQKDEVSDTTEDDSSNAADQTIFLTKLLSLKFLFTTVNK